MSDSTLPVPPAPNIYKMLSIGLIVLGIGMAGGYYLAKNPVSLTPQQGCTMEAKLCPDGSAVGRSGPKCEFSPCPTTTQSPQSTIPSGWTTHTIETEPSLNLSNYRVAIPPSWNRVEHSSNFQNTEVFKSDVAKPLYTLTITQEKNLNTNTGKPYKTLRELTGLAYDVPSVMVDSVLAAQVLPRAGSESDLKVLFFSRGSDVVVSIELNTPRDGSLINEGTQFFQKILSSFTFVN